MTDLQLLIDDVKNLSEEAGEAILAVYQTDFAVEKKQDNTPLTQADMAAHHIIEEGLMALTPNIPVLSEESAHIDFKTRKSWSEYWLVDPLDGTKEFVKGNGEFTVNIAFIRDHSPVMGVIYAPVLGLSYYAYANGGAYKQNKGENPQRIATRVMQKNKLTIAGSRSHGGAGLQRFLKKFTHYDIISMGSSLKSCLVAEGTADIYPRFGPTSEWDTAAAQCVVEEAGGRITDLSMQVLRYNTKSSLLNPYFVVMGDANYAWQDYIDIK